MNRIASRRIGHYLLGGAIACLPPLIFAQDDAAPPDGVLWQTTSQTTMEGMPYQIPAQTHTQCSPVEWTEPPGGGGDDRGCVNSDYARDGLKVTWTSVCSGPPAMSGQGEINFTDDTHGAYSGTIRYAAEGRTVLINLTGERTGTCDYQE